MKRWVLLASLLCVSVTAIAADKLVIYSGRGEALVAPLYEKFTEETGIEVDVRYNSTAALATQVLNEGQYTPADIVFFQESGYLGILSAADLLAPIDKDLLKQVPNNFRDPNGNWIGTSGRMRVLVYNTDKYSEQDLPKSLQELTDNKWQKRIGWAPSNASAHAHISALRILWGEETLREWLQAMLANQPVSYQRNGHIVTAVANGEIDLGWANHYYAHRLKQQNPNLAAANYYFPAEGKAGNVFIISGIGIVNSSKNKAAAEKLVAYLTSEAAQEYFTNVMFEYPTRTGVAVNAELEDLTTLELVEIPQTELADVMPTIAILQEYQLL